MTPAGVPQRRDLSDPPGPCPRAPAGLPAPRRLGARLERLEALGAKEAALALVGLGILLVPAAIGGSGRGPLERRSHPFAPLRIDVNRAPWYEWVLLPGIGEARARRIVKYREEAGGFHGLDDLARVPGLPRGWLEDARPYLYLCAAPGAAGSSAEKPAGPARPQGVLSPPRGEEETTGSARDG